MEQNEKWIRDFHQVSFLLEPSIVRVKADDVLRQYLKAHRNNGRLLADYIRATYEAQYQKELQITRQSLATEIVLHVRADNLLAFMERISRRLHIGRLTKKILWYRDRTAVIDCGERAVDTKSSRCFRASSMRWESG